MSFPQPGLSTRLIRYALVCVPIFVTSIHADSTSPQLAAYYDLKMLLCEHTAYQWTGSSLPVRVADDIVQVGVGRDVSYGLSSDGRLLAWSSSASEKALILDQVRWFASGRTGVFAAQTDGKLMYIARPKRWFTEGSPAQPVPVAASALTASIGDSADYYVDAKGTLHVKGRAHRGQYGDGKLRESETFVPVASDVVSVKAHTGHALLLQKDGTVMGTGGNIYGPLGNHGIGDKAISWGNIFEDATAIATGSSHSVAIDEHGSLWHWGRGIGLDPEKVLDHVVAAAADQSSTIAIKRDGSVWQWKRDQTPVKHFECP